MNESDIERLKIEFSSRMVDHVAKAIISEGKANPELSRNELHLHFIACYLGSLVYTRLLEKPKGKGKRGGVAEYDHALKNFNELKVGTQDAVAKAFQGAMSTFAGQTVDYYCQIKVIPEPVNKLSC